MKRTAIIVITISVSILFSCTTKSKSKEDLLKGNWTTKDMYVTFDGKGTVTSKEQNSADSGKQESYKLINDGQYIVSHGKNSETSDTVKILELNDKILRVGTPEKDTIVLSRVQ